MSLPEPPLDEAVLTLIAERIAAFSGVRFDSSKFPQMKSAIGQRRAHFALSRSAYLARLLADEGELNALIELLLNHETVFFRNRPQFEALRSTILPALDRQLPLGVPLKIWSAGCATGEEAYSIALTAFEVLGMPSRRPLQILATDLSDRALSLARQGRYRGRSLSSVDAPLRNRYFTPEAEGHVLRPEVRAAVHFTRHNLADEPPASIQGAQIIFCQNVTIYFSPEASRRLITRLHQTLAPGGYLFLGFSETLWNIYDRLQLEEINGAFVYRNSPAERRRPQTAPLNERTLNNLPPPAERRRPQTAPLESPPPRPRPQPRPQPPLQAERDLLAEARSLIEQGASQSASELLSPLEVIPELAADVLLLQARIAADRNELGPALALARRALDLQPGSSEAYRLLGMIELRQGRPRTAISYLSQARDRGARSPQVLIHLAEAYTRDSQPRAAVREYRAALELLAALSPDQLVEGVAVGWLRETCWREINRLSL